MLAAERLCPDECRDIACLSGRQPLSYGLLYLSDMGVLGRLDRPFRRYPIAQACRRNGGQHVTALLFIETGPQMHHGCNLVGYQTAAYADALPAQFDKG